MGGTCASVCPARVVCSVRGCFHRLRRAGGVSAARAFCSSGIALPGFSLAALPPRTRRWPRCPARRWAGGCSSAAWSRAAPSSSACGTCSCSSRRDRPSRYLTSAAFDATFPPFPPSPLFLLPLCPVGPVRGGLGLRAAHAARRVGGPVRQGRRGRGGDRRASAARSTRCTRCGWRLQRPLSNVFYRFSLARPEPPPAVVIFISRA